MVTTTTVDQFTTYGFGIDARCSYEDGIAAVKEALKAEGFGVLTEIDVRATMKAKLGVEMDPYIILGACNPNLAHRAIQAEPEIGLLLPCNVVVRRLSDDLTRIEVMDPQAAMGLVEGEQVAAVASEARERLERALQALGGESR